MVYLKQVTFYFILFYYITLASSSKILCVFPTATDSHQAVYRPLVEELARIGHQMFVATTHPSNLTIPNLVEIDWSFARVKMERLNREFSKHMWINWGSDLFSSVLKLFYENLENQMMHKHFRELLNNEKFDLYIVESHNSLIFYALKHLIKAPMIGILSLDLAIGEHELLGNPSHLLLYPNYICTETLIKKNHFDRLKDSTRYLLFKFFEYFYWESMNKLIKLYVSDDIEIWNLDLNLDLVFTSSSPTLGFSRPMVPIAVDVTGIHMRPLQELDEEVLYRLDQAKNGTILLCFGNHVKSELLPYRIQKIILGALAELPFTVIWRSERVDDLPPNVFSFKHLQQNEILDHPNVKLFITHGGYNSMVESISHGVPMVGMPFLGDQFSNVPRIVHYNLGESLDLNYITKESLKATIIKVMNDPKYRRNAVKMSEQIFDQPETPLERAVWWTNYVLRHNGTKHLRSVVQKLPLYQHLCIDIILMLMIPPMMISYLLFICIKLYCKRSKTKIE